MRRTETTKDLPCPLTNEELLERSETLSKLMQDCDQQKDDLKSASTQYRAEIQRIEADIRKVATIISSKKEFRRVICSITYDYKNNQKSFYREDTGELVGTEAMTADERQECLSQVGEV